MEKSINRAEPDDVETLDMILDFSHHFSQEEIIRIAVLPEEADTASFVLAHFNRKHEVIYIQVCPNIAEIDIIIAALEEAKRRMIAYSKQDAA